MPDFVSIEHYGSETKYELPLKWDSQGTAEMTWTIPKDAKLGMYEVSFFKKSDQERKIKPRYRYHGYETAISGRFRVEEFRIPLLKGIIQPPSEALINAREFTLDLGVQYLAGGGAGLLPIKLRSEIRSKYIPPGEGFDEFVFSNGRVREGITRRGEVLESEEEVVGGIRDERKPIKLPSKDLVLDPSGSIRTQISDLPKVDTPKEILTEMEFRDPNGEIQTVSSRIPVRRLRWTFLRERSSPIENASWEDSMPMITQWRSRGSRHSARVRPIRKAFSSVKSSPLSLEM
jgi:hypothetical protein